MRSRIAIGIAFIPHTLASFHHNVNLYHLCKCYNPNASARRGYQREFRLCIRRETLDGEACRFEIGKLRGATRHPWLLLRRGLQFEMFVKKAQNGGAQIALGRLQIKTVNGTRYEDQLMRRAGAR